MACTNPIDAFRLATESLGPTLYKRPSWRDDVWMTVIPRDTYKPHTGLEQSVFTIGRSEPTTDEETWNLIALTSGETYVGSCGTTWNDVTYGFNETTYHPEQFGLRGPVICKDDLIFNWKSQEFLASYLNALSKRAKRSIANRYANIYCHFADKWSCTATLQHLAGSTGDPPSTPVLTAVNQPTSELTQEMLDTIAATLNEEGATDPNSDGWISLGEDGPIYSLYIGQDMSHRILTNNANLRQDFRDAWSGDGQGAMLMKRMGASKVIKNFRHVINLFPPRYNYFGGLGLIRVPTWQMVAGTKGFVAEIHPTYRAADYERADVLTPWCWRSEIVMPINSAAGLNWRPTNYMGEWQFRTGPDIHEGHDCYDPLEKTARHFAEYKHAPKPLFGQYAASIFYKICRPKADYSTVTCTS